MNWQLTIKKVQNGYLIVHEEDVGTADEPEMVTVNQVIEEKDEEDGDKKAMVDLLYMVKEYFGEFYSKHNKVNVEIKLTPYDEE